MQTVLDSVAHAVGHLGTSERDMRRLAAKVELKPGDRLIPVASGCCTPSKSAADSLSRFLVRHPPSGVRQLPSASTDSCLTRRRDRRQTREGESTDK